MPPTEESVTLSHVLYSTISALAQAETVLNLTKSLGKIGTSQAIVNAVTTLNRVNTIPSTSLGTIFDAIGLGYVDTLSVLEETQGQTNENVLLNRVMSILVASQEQSNESINLVRSLGVTPSSQVNVGDAVALNVLRVIAILEETQGSINESVVLNRLLNIVTTSEVVGYETINFNSLYGLSVVTQRSTNGILTLDSSYGLSSLELLEAFEAVSLAKTNNISLTTNAAVFNDITLLTLLLILADPSSAFVVENIKANYAHGVTFRDKRFGVRFRDKRAKGGS